MAFKPKLVRLAKPIIGRFPRAAMTYRYVRDGRRILQEPKRTPLGFKLIGSQNMQRGTFELEEVQIVRSLLQAVDLFINVGANIGYYCCLALSCGKHTVAFEPVESSLRYLYKNIQHNHWENDIEIFPLALSNRAGIMNIYGDRTEASLVKGWAGAAEQYVRPVPTSTMDLVLGARFRGDRCLVLVDIEGAEKNMLEGAGKFLAREPKPIWMVEISITEHQPKGVGVNPSLLSTFQIFWDNGYEAWTANEHSRLVSLDELRAISQSGKNSLLTHNFVFIEGGQKEQILNS
ncbi:MAG: FkbM family methyltransferase [Phycisphaerales bacterium]|nr:MAG: FkbM family methyltransferase [Phycisphaerales bacterium]